MGEATTLKLLLFLGSLLLVQTKRGSGDSLSQNVTKLLNSLLDDYDKRLRPSYGSEPVEIGVTLFIVSISSISEVNMDFTLDFYFRQMWIDRRLSYSDIADEMIISSEMINSIWSPDTFFPDEKTAYFHTATSRNEFVRLRPKGNVLYSMRITVTASCPMDFRYFPLDRQICSLEVESFGYQTKDIFYKWAEGSLKSVGVSSKLSMPQFRLTDYRVREYQITLSTGNYSRLALDLLFVRSLGYYIIQVYVPTILIVHISWISFWLHRSVAPARVSLGITTVLTMTTLISSTNASLPKISYLKSIDVYLVTCFVMVFAALLEYACVFYLTNRCDKHHKKVKAKAKAKAEQDKRSADGHCRCEVFQTLLLQRRWMEDDSAVWRRRDSLVELSRSFSENATRHRVVGDTQQNSEGQRREEAPDHQGRRPGGSEPTPRRHGGSEPTPKRHRGSEPETIRLVRIPDAPQHEEPEVRCFCRIKSTDIDNYSRVIFPLVFACFNVVYWFTYLSIKEETLPAEYP